MDFAVELDSLIVDGRNIDDLADALAERIRRLRGDHALSQGASSAHRRHLPAERIFRSAAGAAASRLTAREVMESRRRPDAEIAHATSSSTGTSSVVHVVSTYLIGYLAAA